MKLALAAGLLLLGCGQGSRLGGVEGRVRFAGSAGQGADGDGEAGTLPEASFLPGHLLLKTDPQLTDEDLSEDEFEVASSLPLTTRWRRVHFVGADGEELSPSQTRALRGRFSRKAGVIACELDYLLSPAGMPDDPLYREQWYLAALDLPRAWTHTQGTSREVVAVVDTGIAAHPDLEGRTVPGYDFVSDPERSGDGDGRDGDPSDVSGDHGTRVAGLIGAAGNDGGGIAGVDWRARLQPIRAVGAGGGSLADLAAAIEWASGGRVPDLPDDATPARIVNLSLAGKIGRCPALLQDVVTDASGRGVLIVAAAGNGGADASRAAPAACRGVLSVGAVDLQGRLASYTNRGAITLVAFGGDLAANPSDGIIGPAIRDGEASWALGQGTSYAAALVTGIASLMRAVNPQLTPREVIERLEGTSHPQSCFDCGAGVVNAWEAVLAAQRPSEATGAPLDISDITLSEGLAGQLTIDNKADSAVHVSLDADGDPWVVMPVLDGEVPAQGSASFPVVIVPSGLEPGEHLRELTIRWADGARTALVRFEVQSGPSDQALQVAALKSVDGELKNVASVSVTTSRPQFSLTLAAGEYLLEAGGRRVPVAVVGGQRTAVDIDLAQ